MIALVMAGGKGSRMDSHDEKLLLKYIHPTILHVVFALQKSKCFSKIIAATSPNSPKTKEMLENAQIDTIETSGNGYSEDLNQILNSLHEDVLVVSGDLPLLDEGIITKIVKQRNPDSLWITFLVTKDFMHSLGLKSEYSVTFQNQECYYTGISLVNAKEVTNFESVEEIYRILNDKKIAFNLNTKEDYELLGSS